MSHYLQGTMTEKCLITPLSICIALKVKPNNSYWNTGTKWREDKLANRILSFTDIIKKYWWCPFSHCFEPFLEFHHFLFSAFTAFRSLADYEEARNNTAKFSTWVVASFSTLFFNLPNLVNRKIKVNYINFAWSKNFSALYFDNVFKSFHFLNFWTLHW